jgi:hypothetical protein
VQDVHPWNLLPSPQPLQYPLCINPHNRQILRHKLETQNIHIIILYLSCEQT